MHCKTLKSHIFPPSLRTKTSRLAIVWASRRTLLESSLKLLGNVRLRVLGPTHYTMLAGNLSIRLRNGCVWLEQRPKSIKTQQQILLRTLRLCRMHGDGVVCGQS